MGEKGEARHELFHGQELRLETEPSLLPFRQYEAVCLSLSDQPRHLLALSAV